MSAYEDSGLTHSSPVPRPMDKMKTKPETGTINGLRMARWAGQLGIFIIMCQGILITLDVFILQANESRNIQPRSVQEVGPSTKRKARKDLNPGPAKRQRLAKPSVVANKIPITLKRKRDSKDEESLPAPKRPKITRKLELSPPKTSVQSVLNFDRQDENISFYLNSYHIPTNPTLKDGILLLSELLKLKKKLKKIKKQ